MLPIALAAEILKSIAPICWSNTIILVYNSLRESTVSKLICSCPVASKAVLIWPRPST